MYQSLLLSFFFTLLNLSLSAMTLQQKQQVVEEIYKKIVQVAKDNRPAPTLNFLPNEATKPNYQAFFSPKSHTINIGEGIYDLALTMGADSTNAMALILGHELAHFYKDHGWSMDFGIKNTDVQIANDIQLSAKSKDESAKLETQADYFGGLFGYLAGYNTLDVSERFFDLYYEKTGIPADLPGYPSKEDRKKIARNTRQELRKLIPVFQAANYATAIGEYEKAAICYQHVLKTFPGRSIYNNVGAALALEAIKLFEPEDLLYLVPIGMDFSTRLKKAKRNIKGDRDVGKEKCYRLLAEAKEQFEQAIELDKSYVQAYINLSLVSSLSREPEMGVAMALKAKKLAIGRKNATLLANAHLALGLAYAYMSDSTKAEEAFQKATKWNPVIANKNLEVLRGTIEHAYLIDPPVSNTPKGAKETINGLSIDLLEAAMEEAAVVKIKGQNADRPNTMVHYLLEKEYEVMAVTVFSKPRSVSAFIKTPNRYSGKSAKGAFVGAPQTLLSEKYGAVTEIITAQQGQLWVYEQDKLIFLVSKKGKVLGWVIWR